MKKEIKSIDNAILDQAAWTFRKFERVRAALHFLKENPREFQIRVEQFDMIVREMNRMMKSSMIDPHNFSHVVELNQLLEGKEIPQLFDLSLQRQLKKLTGKGDSTLLDGIDQAFAETSHWTWPEEVVDDNQLATGVLIEGFGYLLENLTGIEGVKRNFVLGFEEVGIKRNPNSRIMQDVLPWLIEEKQAFSLGVQQAIERLAPAAA